MSLKAKRSPIVLKNFGTVTMLNLVKDDIVGNIEIEIGGSEIQRLVESAFEELPEKTDYQKKCKSSVCGWLFNISSKIDIRMHPVLNKRALKEWGAYQIRKKPVSSLKNLLNT